MARKLTASILLVIVLSIPLSAYAQCDPNSPDPCHTPCPPGTHAPNGFTCVNLGPLGTAILPCFRETLNKIDQIWNNGGREAYDRATNIIKLHSTLTWTDKQWEEWAAKADQYFPKSFDKLRGVLASRGIDMEQVLRGMSRLAQVYRIVSLYLWFEDIIVEFNHDLMTTMGFSESAAQVCSSELEVRLSGTVLAGPLGSLFADHGKCQEEIQEDLTQRRRQLTPRPPPGDPNWYFGPNNGDFTCLLWVRRCFTVSWEECENGNCENGGEGGTFPTDDSDCWFECAILLPPIGQNSSASFTTLNSPSIFRQLKPASPKRRFP